MADVCGTEPHRKCSRFKQMQIVGDASKDSQDANWTEEFVGCQLTHSSRTQYTLTLAARDPAEPVNGG